MNRIPLKGVPWGLDARTTRPLRSATLHRMAAASRGFALAGAGRMTVFPTRSSLLTRALRAMGLTD